MTESVNSSSIELRLSDQSALTLVLADGAEHHDVQTIRCFPLTDPDRWLSICDGHGHELACIVEPSQLSETSRSALAAYRKQLEFQPIVERIHRIEHGPNAVTWTVDTDRGAHTIVVKSDDDVRRLADRQVQIIDTHGIRFRIPDAARLDAASRHLLERYL